MSAVVGGHPRTIRFVPRADQYAWTFGGQAAVLRIRPGDVLDLFTEDAFCGSIRSVDDIPTRAASYPYLNPQTGPFAVEGAEPGDTLAIHLIDIQPARDWAVSTTSPLFGALVGTRQTANLQPDLPERTWIYHVDSPQREVIYQAVAIDRVSRSPCRGAELPFSGCIQTVAPSVWHKIT
jgi:acetamidase/formamidase